MFSTVRGGQHVRLNTAGVGLIGSEDPRYQGSKREEPTKSTPTFWTLKPWLFGEII